MPVINVCFLRVIGKIIAIQSKSEIGKREKQNSV